MGFWKNLWSDVKSAAKDVASGVAKGTKYVGEKLKKAGEWIDRTISDLGKKSSGPTIEPGGITTGGSQNGHTHSQSVNDEEEKRRREKENEVITQYQNEVERRAKTREKNVKNAYLKIYSKYITEFEEVFDDELMDNIKDFIKSASELFTNSLRDEVNTKVNSSYQQWKQLISSHPTSKQLQDYCDKVYTEADNNLLDLLQAAIEDTNKHISKCINKYNDDKAKALAGMKESLIKLNSDEETKAKELKQIAEELVVAQFISNESSVQI